MSSNLKPTKAAFVHHDEQNTPDQSELTSSLVDAIKHLLSQQGYPVDNIRLNDVVKQQSEHPKNNQKLLLAV